MTPSSDQGLLAEGLAEITFLWEQNMKEQVEVAVVQMATAWLKAKQNRAKMVNCARQIAEERYVDLIVFPELANTGYVKGRKERSDV